VRQCRLSPLFYPMSHQHNGFREFVIVTRHGQTELNRHNKSVEDKRHEVLTGRTHTPLTEKGRTQALEAGERLQTLLDAFGWRLKGIVSSPSPRAVDTAMLIGSRLRNSMPDVHTDRRFHERSLGVLENMTIGEAIQRTGLPQEEILRLRQDFDRAPEGGENYTQVTNRVSSGVFDLRREFFQGGSDLQAVLVTGHKGVVRCAKHAFGGLSREEVVKFDVPNADFVVFGFHLREEVLPEDVPTHDRTIHFDR